MIRFLLIMFFLIAFLLFASPILFLLWLISFKWPRVRDRIARVIVYGMFRFFVFIAGTKLIVIGKENIPTDRAVLYVGNHRSYFDILLSYISVPGMTGFISKIEMNRYPILNKWMKAIGCLFLDRNDIRQGMQTILDAVAKIKSGISIFIFPEGTRNKSDNDFLPFRAGSLKIAEKSQCPIVPVSINHSDEIWETQFPIIRKRTVVIEFAPAIYVSELNKEDRRNLHNTVFEQIKTMYTKNKTI